ncbi:MAG TPA: Clp protease N-terminal domain-containing protein [Mycobacteriales bacterium]|nr:Clp protease N-terminal domain-containing protein [Mycobacteriales bacterium]
MAPAPSLEQLIQEVERDAPAPDPLARLQTAAAMLEVVTASTDAALGYFVDQARRAGHSWAEIGASLGVTKQAAQQRQLSRNVTLGVGPVTFERFTQRARNVVSESKNVAVDLGHDYIGTEHLLLALYKQPEGLAAVVLNEAGLTEEGAREAVLSRVAMGSSGNPMAPFTPKAMAVFSKALSIALDLGHNYIGTEHLLLGLHRGDGVAANVLEDAGIAYHELVALVLRKLSDFVAKNPPSSKSRESR